MAVVPARTRIEPLYKHLRRRPLVRTLVVAATMLAAGVQASSAASGDERSIHRLREEHSVLAVHARWSVVSLGPGHRETLAMACPSTRVCYVTGLIAGKSPPPSARSSPSFRTTMFQTTDGGTTWKATTITPNEAALYSISCPSVRVCFTVATSYNNRINPATAHTSIIATHDAGLSWQTVFSSGVTDAAATRCITGRAGCILPTAVTCPAITVCYTPAASIPYSRSRQAHPATQLLLTTRNSGRTWNTAAFKPFGSSPLSCPTVSTCYAFGRFASVTTDGGRSWRRQPSGPSSLVHTATCPGVRVCYVLGSGLQGPGKLTLAVSKDAGRTWVRRYFPPELYAISCPSIATCYTVGGDTSGQVGTVLITRDGGMKWLHESVPNIGNPLTLVSVACPRVNICFAAVHEGSVLIRHG